MKNRFWLYAGLIMAGIVVIAPLTGYVVGRVLAGRLGDGMMGALEDSVGAHVVVQRVSVTALLQIVLEGVQVNPADGEEGLPFAEVNRVVVYPQLFTREAEGAKINGILLDRPVLYLRVGEDGELNIRRWVDAVRDCDDLSAMKGFPNRIIVRNGSVLIQQAGGGGDRTTFIEEIRGQAGKTVSSGVVVDLKGRGPAGGFTVKGDLAPCGGAGGGVNLDISSKRWDFDAFKLAVLRWIGGADGGPAADFQAGAGKLDARVFGGFDSLRAEGKIRTDRFSARFSLSPEMINIAELSAKAEGGGIKGGGSVRFDSANMPVRMAFVLEDIETVRLLRGLFGYQFAPRARLNGFLKMNGSLNAPGALRQTGGVEAGAGEIRLPPLNFGRFRRLSAIPFEGFRGRVVRDVEETSLYDAVLFGPGLNVTGRANFSGGLLNPGEAQPAAPPAGRATTASGFSASFEFDVSDIGELLSGGAGRDLLGGGSAKGEVHVEGTAGRASPAGRAKSARGARRLSGGGKVVLSKGRLVNPYADMEYAGGADRLSFDNISARFSFTESSFRLAECELDGDGLHIEISGGIGEGGELEFKGRARMAGDVARRFAGLSRVIDRRDMTSSVTFDIPFSIRGDVEEPVVRWSGAEEKQ